MSQTNQVAVASPSALAPSSHATDSVAKNRDIPRFLLKIYEIVNDPANESLIKWSEAGDSFYIYDHERFAREVLGKWFKHQNFSSFVRQLNLYGFRKISALQQGLVRSTNSAETIQFAHPYFHRGQPDLLALIQRKRPPANATHAENSTVGLLQPSSQDNQGQSEAVDMRSIVEGISAIRRQQQAISSDLSALKDSNDALWKEAIAARERHAQHGDTINRILRFLAGIVGRAVQGPSSAHPHVDGNTRSTKRLMIGDGRQSYDEVGDFGSAYDPHSRQGSREHTPFSVGSERFATIETPDEPSSPTTRNVQLSIPKSPSVAPPASSALSQSDPAQNAAWQRLHQVFTSPAQFQQLPQPLMSTQYQNSSALQGALMPANASQQQLTFPPSIQPSTSASTLNQLAPVTESQNVLAPPQAALLESTDRISKLYRDKAEIDADVDTLQSNIHTLIRDLGFDPHNQSFATSEDKHFSSTPSGGGGDGDTGHDAVDFSTLDQSAIDQWFNELADGGGDYGKDVDFSAFLDVPPDLLSADTSAAAATPTPMQPDVSSPSGQKRKLDAEEVGGGVPVESAPSTKRKR